MSSDDDKIIRHDFRRPLGALPAELPHHVANPFLDGSAEPIEEEPVEFGEDDKLAMPPGVSKALAILNESTDPLNHRSFIIIGIKPTETGADFSTAWHGSRTDLNNALEHLDGVIRRMYHRERI